MNFGNWLAAQADSDLTTLGFTSSDITFLRGAFADLAALSAITNNGLPPGTYPQPASTYPYLVNAKQLIGPL